MIGVAVKDACQTLLKDTMPRSTKETLAGAAASLKVPSRACRRSVRVHAQCAANCEVWAPFPTPRNSALGNAYETTCGVLLLYRPCIDHRRVCDGAGARRPPQVSSQLCPGDEPAACCNPHHLEHSKPEVRLCCILSGHCLLTTSLLFSQHTQQAPVWACRRWTRRSWSNS